LRGSSCAGFVVGGWMGTGFTGERAIAVGMAGLVDHGIRKELVDQVRKQGLQIHYDDKRVEIRSDPATVKTVEPARRPVQPVLALDWCDEAKTAEMQITPRDSK
jgi:hypothetical protein